MHFNIHTFFRSCLPLARRGKKFIFPIVSNALESSMWTIWRTARNGAAPTFPKFVCLPPTVLNPEIIIAHWRNSILNFYHWYYHLIVQVTIFLLFAILWFANRNAIRYFRWTQIIAFQSIRNGWSCEHLAEWLHKTREPNKKNMPLKWWLTNCQFVWWRAKI